MYNKKLIENYLPAAVIWYENLQAMSGMPFPPDPDWIVEKPKWFICSDPFWLSSLKTTLPSLN